MKDVVKFGLLFIVGMSVALFIYPLVHELSHSFVAIIVGAKVININIFPVPYVLCDVSNISNVKSAIIGLSGTVLPFLISIITKSKLFWLWYANFVMQGINLMALVLAFVSTMFFAFGIPFQNDDFTQILLCVPNVLWGLMIFVVGLLIVQIILLGKEKPLKKCIDYFI